MSLEKLIKEAKFDGEIIDIKKAVARHYEVPLNKIDKRSRKREVVQLRQITHWLASKLTKKSLIEIGKETGRFDHATVMHNRDFIQDMISEINGRVLNRKIYGDIARILIEIRNYKLINAQETEEHYYLSMGTMISYQNYCES